MIVGGALILLYDMRWVDPVITIGIALYILYLAVTEISGPVRTLMLCSPPEIDNEEVSTRCGGSMNRPGFAGGVSFESRCHGRLFQHGVVSVLGFGRRDVADGLQKPALVEPVDPGQRGELDGLEAPPWSSPVNDLSLVKAIDRLGESVVIGSPTLPTEGSIPASARRSV